MGHKDLPIAYGCAFRANSEPQAEESGLLSGSSACFGALPSDRPPARSRHVPRCRGSLPPTALDGPRVKRRDREQMRY